MQTIDEWEMDDQLVVPDYFFEDWPLPEEPRCECGCRLHGESAVEALVAAVRQLQTSPPSPNPEQALIEAAAVLRAEQQLKIHGVRRIADVEARGLHEIDGHRSVRTWLQQQRPDGDATDASLAMALREFSRLEESVAAGTCSLGAARKVVRVLRLARAHVDQGDGLIDGSDAMQVMAGVVGNVVTLACRYLHGLDDNDPRLAQLQADTEEILTAGGAELVQLEAAFTLLAEQVPLPALTSLLDELLMALLPSELERRAEQARERAGLVVTRKHDGSGWQLKGDLDLECGERLFTALRSEAARDPQNPIDTELWVQSRDGGMEPWETGAEQLKPRDKRRRLHDALDRLLGRYLAVGLGGVCDKVPVQVHVTIPGGGPTSSDVLPLGSLPARADSGQLIPRSLVRRWWCDSQVTAFVMSLGGKALRTIHSQRTLTARERRALHLESGGRCAGLGCCREGPLLRLAPHHVTLYSASGRTSMDETLLFCDLTHGDLHRGKTILLKDGRYVSEHGISDKPPDPQPPPF